MLLLLWGCRLIVFAQLERGSLCGSAAGTRLPLACERWPVPDLLPCLLTSLFNPHLQWDLSNPGLNITLFATNGVWAAPQCTLRPSPSPFPSYRLAHSAQPYYDIPLRPSLSRNWGVPATLPASPPQMPRSRPPSRVTWTRARGSCSRWVIGASRSREPDRKLPFRKLTADGPAVHLTNRKAPGAARWQLLWPSVLSGSTSAAAGHAGRHLHM